MAACVAYIWLVYLGAIWVEEGGVGISQRRHRCDVSVFQLGLRFLDHVLNAEIDTLIMVAFLGNLKPCIRQN
jgi:hypothetical protein